MMYPSKQNISGQIAKACSVLSLVLVTVLANSAEAGQRVIVIMKDRETFNTANLAFRTKGSYSLRSLPKRASVAGIEGKVEASLEHLNTLIVDAKDEDEIAKLQADPAVAYVEKEIFHAAPRPVAGWVSTPVLNLNSASGISTQSEDQVQIPGLKTPWGIAAVKAPQAWSISNQGLGARVLILDTGIDANHPSIKGNFEQGRDFTEDSNGEDFSDTVGHGTHVAGTIAGVMDSEGFTGVAPKAKILMGRVCLSRGCSNVAVAEGINWGISQKVDLVSMSLGGSISTPAERDAIAKADRAGIPVIAASGNDGTAKISYPAALSTVIAVGAVDENSKHAGFSQYGPELAIVAPGVNVVSSVPMGSGREASVTIMVGDKSVKVNSATFQGAREVLNGETNTLIDVGLGKTEDFADKNVKGKFALIARGGLPFLDKVKNSIAAGATGVIIYNNAPGLVQGALTNDGTTLPLAVFMIEQEVGQKLSAELQAGAAVMANLQTVATNYASFQGTSMATPHVAGVVALMKAVNKNLKSPQVKAILKKTAVPLSPNLNNEYGAGLVDAQAAVVEAARVK